jgi:hypothetical protein
MPGQGFLIEERPRIQMFARALLFVIRVRTEIRISDTGPQAAVTPRPMIAI